MTRLNGSYPAGRDRRPPCDSWDAATAALPPQPPPSPLSLPSFSPPPPPPAPTACHRPSQRRDYTEPCSRSRRTRGVRVPNRHRTPPQTGGGRDLIRVIARMGYQITLAGAVWCNSKSSVQGPICPPVQCSDWYSLNSSVFRRKIM